MAEAKEGDVVKVHYTGKLSDGTEFDTSANEEPLEFTVGAGEVIPGFDEAVVGMNPGETKTTTIAPDAAYGDYDEELLLEVERSDFPANITPEVGQHLKLKQADGEVLAAVITEVDDEVVTVDANHPLAGKDLTFEIQLLAIE
jgi:peptidylprolyl isomerase